MSTLPLQQLTSRQNKGWSTKEDQALKWAWKAGASDEEIASYFGRTEAAVKQRASVLDLGRRKYSEAASPVLKAENESLKVENSKLEKDIQSISTAFDATIELFQNINKQLKNR